MVSKRLRSKRKTRIPSFAQNIAPSRPEQEDEAQENEVQEEPEDENEEMEYEDPYGDEWESAEGEGEGEEQEAPADNKTGDDAEGDGEGDDTVEELTEKIRVWRPGKDQKFSTEMTPGENGGDDKMELEFSPAAYKMLHEFTSEWPCLSFDVLRDSNGYERQRFPYSLYLAGGTQADKDSNNKVGAMRLSNLTKMELDDDDPDNEDEEEDDDDDDGDVGDPVFSSRWLPHTSAVNRFRSMPQYPYVCATYSESGDVDIWHLGSCMTHIDMCGTTASGGVETASPSSGKQKRARGQEESESAPARGNIVPQINQNPLLCTVTWPQSSASTPVFHKKFKREGYGLDWSTVKAGRLATGDIAGTIRIYDENGGKWSELMSLSHGEASVEEIQWSPTEEQILITGGTDGNIMLWDVRTKKCVRSLKAHTTDINVMSWNRKVTNLLATGADDGVFRVWDLNALKSGSMKATDYVANFAWHKQAITSVEWHPTDSSVLGVASADNTVTIWDLSVERDADDPTGAEELNDEDLNDIPPQLLFEHQVFQAINMTVDASNME